eukprot:TRINITY_DN42344_c0_g1_i1.p1 TRINITY_DN42344_c0_g1~~TRINITY_DN42344_c0_g1_i1.p1  ORF type:complete len:304 (-),score=48.99 TRINITY_DN42344_c0_g1_i1:35-946(-)
MAPPTKNGAPPMWKNFIAGTVGGIALTVAGHPLDTIKVRLQAMPAPAAGEAPMFRGAFDCFSKTCKSEGFMALYRGVLSPVLGAGALYAFCFAVNGWARKTLHGKREGVFNISTLMGAGAITGAASTSLIVPIELLKNKMQVQYSNLKPGVKPQYNGVVDCAVKTVKSEGFPGLYRGLLITLYRDIPGRAVYFGAYEIIKRMLTPKEQKGQLSPGRGLIAGGLVGIVAWLVILPIDIAKTRLQTSAVGTYSGMFDCYAQILKQHGIKGLYAGIKPAMLRSFPANAACFYAFELTMKILNSVSN